MKNMGANAFQRHIRTVFLFFIFCSGLFLFSPFAVARKPMIISDTEIESLLTGKFRDIWNGMSDVLHAEGRVLFEHRELGRIEIEPDENRRVVVRLEQMNGGIGRVRVEAYLREGLRPDLHTARRILKKIERNVRKRTQRNLKKRVVFD